MTNLKITRRWVALMVILTLVLLSYAWTSAAPVESGVRTEAPERTKEPFLEFLRACESGGNDKAINWYDSDGTASYGRYQFKPKTLWLYATRYGVLTDIEQSEVMNLIMDGELQETIVRKMIKDKEVDLGNEFPACYRKWKTAH